MAQVENLRLDISSCALVPREEDQKRTPFPRGGVHARELVSPTMQTRSTSAASMASAARRQEPAAAACSKARSDGEGADGGALPMCHSCACRPRYIKRRRAGAASLKSGRSAGPVPEALRPPSQHRRQSPLRRIFEKPLLKRAAEYLFKYV